jgi:hypothetical protein
MGEYLRPAQTKNGRFLIQKAVPSSKRRCCAFGAFWLKIGLPDSPVNSDNFQAIWQTNFQAKPFNSAATPFLARDALLYEKPAILRAPRPATALKGQRETSVYS